MIRDKCPCESQLIGFIDDIVNAVHGRNQTDEIKMDFSKEFDKVSHCLLVDKLWVHPRTHQTMDQRLTV